MRIVWTQEALDRLSDIEDFISKDSPQRAARFINYLVQRGEGVSKNPRIGRTVPEISISHVKEIIAQKYRIVYPIQENRIEILKCVFCGGKMNHETLLSFMILMMITLLLRMYRRRYACDAVRRPTRRRLLTI